ncbi:MAG: hypothetical protein KVP17_001157 [Porospora cf. gigantea B]|uniref:uncharacterized protein n=1 Tax=Porospora cf. gigantea B TaxID=2853592 RepID=UPI00357180F7|nr:MAG: hypothetical protein KVP17_001157 [Porospora cf. gigantea B]
MDAIMRSRSLRSHLSAGILHEDERYSDLEEPPAQTVNLKDALLPHTYDTGGASRSLSHLAKVRNQKRSELLRSAFYRDLEFKSESESGLSDVADNHQESHSGSHFFAELDEQLQFRHSHSNSNSRTSSPENRPPPKRARTSVGVRTGERTQPCMICLCTDIDKPSSTNACSHVFCFECLVKWSEMTNKCPICKLEFSRIKSKAEGTARSIPVVRKDLLRHLRDEEDYYCLRCGSCECVDTGYFDSDAETSSCYATL